VSTSNKKFTKYKRVNISTADEFYRLFCTLPKSDRLIIARHILEDEEIQNDLEILNKTTLEAFSEDKKSMPSYNTVDELRKDLLT
jgi:hypothetical protein